MKDKKFTFISRTNGVSFLFAQYLLAKEAYGRFDYLIILEKQCASMYLSEQGLRQYYNLGKKLLDEQFIKKLFREIDSFILKLKRIKGNRSVNDSNIISTWSLIEEHYLMFVKLYGICETPIVVYLEELLLNKIKDKQALSEIFYDKRKIKKYKLNIVEKQAFDLINLLGRKRYLIHKNILPLAELIDRVCFFLAKKYRLSPMQIYSHTKDEFSKLIKNGVTQKSKILDSRAKGLVFLKKGSAWKYFGGKDYVFWKNKLESKQKIAGAVAFPGIIIGKVKLHLDWVGVDKNIKRGMILVSGMTSPQMVPFLKKVKGIITDEGGLTCHAAIISRELKIPCIVGTGNATQILHDGDLVEVDANNGVVNILKRAK